MPMYEYQCQSCHRTLEKRQKFSDAPLTECPHCGGRLEKLISAPAVQFKGGGWYADLYSSSKGGSKAAASADSAASSSGEGSKAAASSDSTSSGSSAPASAPAASSTSSSTSK